MWPCSSCREWHRKQSSKMELGREYYFSHTACFPCVDSYDLYADGSADWNRWQRLKSWSRHIPTPMTCLQVAIWYWPPVLLAVGMSGLVAVYHIVCEPRGAPDVTHHDLTTPFTVTATALALILTFRTNSAYDRWWEARKILGGLLGLTRDLMRQAMTGAKPDSQELVAMMGRWVIAMPYILRTHITEFRDVPLPLKKLLNDRELAFLTAAHHRPAAVSQVLSDTSLALARSDYVYSIMSARISQYADMVAASERLLRQPIPTAYTRHTSRFVIIWIILLPWALWQTCQWLTPFVAGVVAFLVVGIENIGIQIEQPFSVLPLDSFSRIIEADTMEQLQMRGASELLVAAAGEELRDGPPPSAPGDDSNDWAGLVPPPRSELQPVWPTGFGNGYSRQVLQKDNGDRLDEGLDVIREHCFDKTPNGSSISDDFASAPPSLPGGAHHPPAVQLMGDAATSGGGLVHHVSPPRAAGAPLPDGTAQPPSAEGAQGWASAGDAPGPAAGEDDSGHSRRSSVPDLAGSRHGYGGSRGVDLDGGRRAARGSLDGARGGAGRGGRGRLGLDRSMSDSAQLDSSAEAAVTRIMATPSWKGY